MKSLKTYSVYKERMFTVSGQEEERATAVDGDWTYPSEWLCSPLDRSTWTYPSGDRTSSARLLTYTESLSWTVSLHRNDIKSTAKTKHSSTDCTGWRRGSVVRTAVFNWRTFPDLRLIYGWHVTTSRVRCPLWVNQPDQLSLPSFGVGEW